MIKTSAGTLLRAGLAFSLGIAICGCSKRNSAVVHSTPTEAQESDIVIGPTTPGVSPFIATVEFEGQSVSDVTAITFNIAPKPNTVSKPVSVTWDKSALVADGYLETGSIQLPVFGLYDGYQNQVTFQVQFLDDSVQQLAEPIGTQPYTDPTGVYADPVILKARAPGSNLGFNFFVMKSNIGPPVIVDTDGYVRWVIPDFLGNSAVIYTDGRFLIGDGANSTLYSIPFSGNTSILPVPFPQPLMQSFTHNIDPGTTPNSFLAEFTGTDDLGVSNGDIVTEFTPTATQPILQTFDMADILTAYMKKNGDDPTTFVRPGVDWFHINASVYDPSDDSIIVSSRENFLIKLDYQTKDIKWILGDPTKYWYTFPSLRAKALTLAAGGDYPVGQHAVSITTGGYVMVFNDGYGSLNQPSGEPAGITRTFSEVSVYSINPTAMTASQVWKFDYGQSIYSEICGSSYEASGNTFLVDFANSDKLTHARLVGLDSSHNVVFDFQYDQPQPCGAAWNAIPIALEDLVIN